MVLGALLDLGLPLDALRETLGRLPLEGYRLEAHSVLRSGLRATKLDVLVDAPHGRDADHGQARGLLEILSLIDRSGLDAAIKHRAAACFRRLADAEASVHGTSPEAVHFHEVGAVDSVVDVVGGVCGLAWLGASRFVASPLNVGSGTV